MQIKAVLLWLQIYINKVFVFICTFMWTPSDVDLVC